MSAFEATFQQLKVRFEPLLRSQAERECLEAPHFDIFDWLGIARSEDAHTRVLANLLNPNGSHGQGNLFLEQFLRTCQSTLLGFPQILAANIPPEVSITVIDEEASVFGRTDIRIASNSAESPFALIIENKIDAGLQEHQLERYWKRLRHDFPLAGANRVLLYLTPTGKDPEPLPVGIPYFPISYNTHIARWLEPCVGFIKPNTVKGFVSNYAQIASALR